MSSVYTPQIQQGGSVASNPLYTLVGEVVIPSGTSGKFFHIGGLNGNVDEFYRLEWEIIASGLGTIVVRPNNIGSTNQAGSFYRNDGANSVTGGGAGGLVCIGQPNNNNDQLVGFADIDARPDRKRTGIGRNLQCHSTGGVYNETNAGVWNDKATNLTGVVIASASMDIKGPSYIRMYRVTKE
jgi:hypothetical protein